MGTIFQHKGVTAELQVLPEFVTVIRIESTNKGKGEVQEALQMIREKYSDRPLASAATEGKAMRHICNKLKVPTLEMEYEGDFVKYTLNETWKT